MGVVVPAILPKSEADLDATLARYTGVPAVSRIQIDIVDGRFATPPSWPFVAPKELRDRIASGALLPALNRIEYEIDLMTFTPEEDALPWLSLGVTRLTFHAESTTNLPQLLRAARERVGHIVTFGVALHSESDPALIASVLEEIAYVQCMGIKTVGRQGQPFDDRVYERVRMVRARYPDLPVQVDGGISFDTAKTLLSLGVSTLVIGSGLLAAARPDEAIAAFESLVSGPVARRAEEGHRV